MKKTCLALAAGLMLSFPAFAEITVTDVKGREVTVPDVPKRVVLGFYYEDYLAVAGPGAADRLVGLSLTTWKDWRPKQYALYEKALPQLAKLTDVGTTDDNTFSVEKVISTKPDLVILGAWNYDALGESVKQIEAAGIPVLVLDYNAQTVEKHVASTLALGKIMGQEKRAQELADNYKKAFEDIDARIKKAGPTQKKVYVELAQKGPSEVGNSYGNSMWGALITQLGGHNIADGQIGNWGPLSPEYVLSQKPDLIFLSGSEWLNKPQAVEMGFDAKEAVTQERIAAYLKRPGWSNLPAVKNHEVHGIYAGGARTLSDYVYAQYIAKQLYPDAFKDVDPQQNLRDFYEKWLPVKADGEFMLPYTPVAGAAK